MYYGMSASHPGEWLAIKAGKVPQPILDVILGPIQARALVAAARSGLLAAIGAAPGSHEALADRCGLDAECTRLVLRVLRDLGYTKLRAGAWSLTAVGERHFGSAATEPYDAFVRYGAPQWSMIEKLDGILATGRGVDFHDTQTATEWGLYQEAMLENARAFAWFVVDNLPVPRGATRCLDIAGAHGFVGRSLAARHPGLRATVVDRAEALPHARRLATEQGYADELEFVAADVRRDPLGRDADVVLLCNILHHFGERENLDILARVRAASRAGASIGIFEIETPPDDAPPDAAGDGFALYFRITSSATCYRGGEYVRWLEASGFADARIVRSVRMPSRMLITARAA